MSWCPVKDFWKWKKEVTNDDSGRQSLAKNLIFFGFIFATLMCIKLVTMGGFSEGYFTAYLAIASGHSGLSKWLDTKKPTPVQS